MDKEILYINNILLDNPNGLTTSDISKIIFEKHGLKISRTIVKNYLWSYFRNQIKYNSADFTYILENDRFLLDDIDIIKVEKTTRSIDCAFVGSKIKVEYDASVSIETLIKAISIINYKSPVVKNNTDLIKQINRVVEQII